MVLMGSLHTGHFAFAPLLWSKTTVLPQWGHSLEVSLSVRTSMTLPQAQSIFFRAKKPFLASAYFPQRGHSITNLDMVSLFSKDVRIFLYQYAAYISPQMQA
jgi:hypothetical protein